MEVVGDKVGVFTGLLDGTVVVDTGVGCSVARGDTNVAEGLWEKSRAKSKDVVGAEEGARCDDAAWPVAGSSILFLPKLFESSSQATIPTASRMITITIENSWMLYMLSLILN